MLGRDFTVKNSAYNYQIWFSSPWTKTLVCRRKRRSRKSWSCRGSWRQRRIGTTRGRWWSSVCCFPWRSSCRWPRREWKKPHGITISRFSGEHAFSEIFFYFWFFNFCCTPLVKYYSHIHENIHISFDFWATANNVSLLYHFFFSPHVDKKSSLLVKWLFWKIATKSAPWKFYDVKIVGEFLLRYTPWKFHYVKVMD